MTDIDYLVIMMAKLIDVIDRKDTERDGNWGYPSFRQEISEMKEEIFNHPAVKKAPKTTVFI